MRIDSSAPSQAQPKEPSDLRKAAADFEALVLTELLREIRFAGPDGEQSDQASSTMLGFGHEQMARAIAASGGLGLASIAVKGLEHAKHAAPSTADSKTEPVVR